MAMILDAFMSKCCTLLIDAAFEQVIMVLGVKDELQKLLGTMKHIRCLLKDAEKRKFNDSSIDLWLSELKDVMYDADDIIDLCTIKGNQLLADENPKNKTSPVCCNFSSTFSSCFTSVPLSTLQLEFSDDLLELEFSDDLYVRSEEQMGAVEELFDKIIPPQSLKELYIFYFFGRRFPNWMAATSFENYVSNLTELGLWHIKSCAELPSLGQLPKLRQLCISVVEKVKKIGPEFLGVNVNSTIGIAFPKLEMLAMKEMHELEEWSFGAQVEDNASPRLKILPCLHTLQILGCRLLKQLPKGLKHLPIKSLRISSAHSLKIVDDLPSEVEELKLSYITHLERVCCLPMLKQLCIRNCRALSCVEKLDSLQQLELEDDIHMESLPDWLLMLLRQQALQNEDFLFDLRCSEKVLEGCLEGGSYWELIQQIPRVTACDVYGRSYLRYNKHPYVYEYRNL